MRRITMLTLLVFFCRTASAQLQNKSISIEETKQTSLLLTELQNKVNQIANLRQKLANNVWNDAQEKESTIIQLDDAFTSLKVFVYNSLEQRCTDENRLMEISNVVRSVDPNMAVKYAMLSEELKNTQK